MSTNPDSHYEFLSIIEFLAPREKHIMLVPLTQVSESDTIFIWAAVFWNIFAITLGAIISLILISYENTPVNYLLSIFALTFLVLGLFFTKHGVRLRMKLKDNSGESQSFRKDLLMRKLNQLRTEALVYRFHRDLGTKVFDNKSELEVTEFKENLNQLLAVDLDANLQKEVLNRLIEDGMISVKKRNGQGPVFKYNKEYVYKTQYT